jgi:hypothetical protein
MTGVNRETIGTLLVRVGDGCADLLDRTMVNLDCDRLEIDELWAFVGKTQHHVTKDDDKQRAGDTWTFVAVDAETMLVPSFLVGKRDTASTQAFIADVAARLKNRVQISSDGLHSYIEAIGAEFAETGGLRAAPQNVRGRSNRSGTLQPAKGDRDGKDADLRCARRRPSLNQLRRTPEPHGAHGCAPRHALDQRFQQKARKPSGGNCTALRALQFRAQAPDAARVAGHGRRRLGNALERRRLLNATIGAGK